MSETEQLLSELEAVTAQMAPVKQHSLEAFSDLCARRGELIRQLSGRLDVSLVDRVKAVVQAGEETARALDAIRQSLRQDLRDLESSLHVARQWGANVTVAREGMKIDA